MNVWVNGHLGIGNYRNLRFIQSSHTRLPVDCGFCCRPTAKLVASVFVRKHAKSAKKGRKVQVWRALATTCPASDMHVDMSLHADVVCVLLLFCCTPPDKPDLLDRREDWSETRVEPNSWWRRAGALCFSSRSTPDGCTGFQNGNKFYPRKTKLKQKSKNWNCLRKRLWLVTYCMYKLLILIYTVVLFIFWLISSISIVVNLLLYFEFVLFFCIDMRLHNIDRVEAGVDLIGSRVDNAAICNCSGACINYCNVALSLLCARRRTTWLL